MAIPRELDSLTVIALLEHVDGTMLARVYSHLQQNAGHLLAAPNRPFTAANASHVNGVDAVTTSILAGHRDTTMISRFYAHLTQRADHMRKAANRARAASASG